MLRNEILTDKLAKKEVGKAIYSVSLMAVALMAPIGYLIQ